MKYRAFVSYSHSDASWARWIHRSLERYRVPKHIVESRDLASARLAPVFLDREEFGSAASLSASIRDALAASEALIVVCSPAAAASRWVNQEIEEFTKLHGGDNVFCCIVEGCAPDVFPPALTGADEPLAADLTERGDGRRAGFIKLVAGLLGVGFDELRRREDQVRQRRLALLTAAALAGMAVMSTLGISAIIARNEAEEARDVAEHRREQAEDLLAFMVGDLRESLQPLGRLSLLDGVGDQAMAYFESVDPEAITDRSLTLQSRVLTQIGEIRMWQFQYEAAVEAFAQAYRFAEPLTRRYPGNGEMLFQRSQAEFWTGNMSWRNGDLDEAERWLRRYRDSSLELSRLDPSRDDWMLEVAYGYHNLGVLAVEQRRLAEARRLFEEELVVLEELSARSSADMHLEENFADAHSWLGTAAERAGDLDEARFRHDESTRYRGVLMEAAPDDQTRRLWFVVSRAFSANARAITGQVDEALTIYGELMPILDQMVEQDDENRQVLRLSARIRVDRAELRVPIASADERDGILAEVDSAAEALAALLEDQPEDRRARVSLVKAHRVLAKLHLLDGAAEAAMGEASRSLALMPDEPRDVQLIQELGAALVIEAAARERAGLPVAADASDRRRPFFLREAAESDDPRTLDASARILRLDGDPDRAEAIVRRLEAAGYVPIWPWSATPG